MLNMIKTDDATKIDITYSLSKQNFILNVKNAADDFFVIPDIEKIFKNQTGEYTSRNWISLVDFINTNDLCNLMYRMKETERPEMLSRLQLAYQYLNSKKSSPTDEIFNITEKSVKVPGTFYHTYYKINNFDDICVMVDSIDGLSNKVIGIEGPYKMRLENPSQPFALSFIIFNKSNREIFTVEVYFALHSKKEQVDQNKINAKFLIGYDDDYEISFGPESDKFVRKIKKAILIRNSNKSQEELKLSKLADDETTQSILVTSDTKGFFAKNWKLILLISFGVILLLILVAVIVFAYKNKEKNYTRPYSDGSVFYPMEPPMTEYDYPPQLQYHPSEYSNNI